MKPTPKYLSKAKLVRYGSVKKLTKRELISLAKKKSIKRPNHGEVR